MALMMSKAVFIHMPRTGGTWLENFLKIHIPCRHEGFKHIRAASFPFNNRYKFSFVRNPIHWYISKYSSPTHLMRLAKGTQGTASKINPVFLLDALNSKESFHQWMKRHLNKRAGW